jgi:hypothetical protein
MPEIEITQEMIDAGADAIYDADWEFRADAWIVAERVYRVMAGLSDHPSPHAQDAPEQPIAHG